MACFWIHCDETDISIPTTEEVEGLHQHLVTDHGVSRDILPPKKVIKNKCPVFIEQRKNGLEIYLKHVLKYLQCTMPRVFTSFLCFQDYDVFFILQDMAKTLYTESDNILQSTKSYTFNIMQIHAISEFFKKPYPNIEETDKRYDPCHVFDLCSQLHHLKISGINPPYKDSNIVPNDLLFELSAFRSLETLDVYGISLKNLYSVGNLRETVKVFNVQYTTSTSIADVLMCDVIHKSSATDNEVWQNITELDLSCNKITTIDKSIKLVPNLCTLSLTTNFISKIENLTHLANLSNLNLSKNVILDCSQLHTKLGNILCIDLSQNGIDSLKGFEKLYSLESLDVSSNKICNVEEVKYIGELPCLENLRLTGNPVAVIVDYRVKVLEYFGSRAGEIYLDNEKPTQKEIDTASVLNALRIVKEGKTPNLK